MERMTATAVRTFLGDVILAQLQKNEKNVSRGVLTDHVRYKCTYSISGQYIHRRICGIKMSHADVIRLLEKVFLLLPGIFRFFFEAYVINMQKSVLTVSPVLCFVFCRPPQNRQ